MTDNSRRIRGFQELVLKGAYGEAATSYRQLLTESLQPDMTAVVYNDLAVISAIRGEFGEAEQFLADATSTGNQLESTAENYRILEELTLNQTISIASEYATGGSRPVKVAVLSFLFNWPSTGGGIIHTVELVRFLRLAGYEVELFYTEFEQWQIGNTDATCPVTGTAIRFDGGSWNPAEIRKRYRDKIDEFQPDHVIITDCWNFKPHLAEAMRGYSYFLRMQAQEMLCPLNNLRLLPGENGLPLQCKTDQLAASRKCFDCLVQNGRTSGGLHQMDRQLSGVGSEAYNKLLRQSLRDATAVLVLNPEVAKRFGPWATRVEVATWGMDSDRFPWPVQQKSVPGLPTKRGVTRILFAGVTDEPIKGFNVLHEACRILRSSRTDFELVVTDRQPGQIDEFTTSVGWKTQSELPAVYSSCDVCVVPTIAQDGLSRTSVEAMASGLPVVASNIGGIPFTVEDHVTGLLFEPGSASELAEKLASLLDDRELRIRLGHAGREAFESKFQWSEVIRNRYTPLLTPVGSRGA